MNRIKKMAVSFHIPKQSDKEIVDALMRVSNALKETVSLEIILSIPPSSTQTKLKSSESQLPHQVQFILDEHSQLIETFSLNIAGQTAFYIRRKEEVTDLVSEEAGFTNHIVIQEQDKRTELYVRLLSALRRELKASDVDASFSGEKDTDWNRYRKAQAAVLSSLEKALNDLILKASKDNAELDRQRAERFENLEAKLREELQSERARLHAEVQAKEKELDRQSKQLQEKEAAFETKESHYVARQKQSEQIEKVQQWLEGWNLTKGTTQKRWPIAIAYIAVIFATAAWSYVSGVGSYEVLQNTELNWWQWTSLWFKSVIPFAALVTFIVYFIRWSSDWARQHSDEEFRNRALLMDIGRAAWLLEAVRDAQVRKDQLPPELLAELSRGLFSNNSRIGPDVSPRAIADLLMDGLSGLRVRSPDGSEIEATKQSKRV